MGAVTIAVGGSPPIVHTAVGVGAGGDAAAEIALGGDATVDHVGLDARSGAVVGVTVRQRTIWLVDAIEAPGDRRLCGFGSHRCVGFDDADPRVQAESLDLRGGEIGDLAGEHFGEHALHRHAPLRVDRSLFRRCCAGRELQDEAIGLLEERRGESW